MSSGRPVSDVLKRKRSRSSISSDVPFEHAAAIHEPVFTVQRGARPYLGVIHRNHEGLELVLARGLLLHGNVPNSNQLSARSEATWRCKLASIGRCAMTKLRQLNI